MVAPAKKVFEPIEAIFLILFHGFKMVSKINKVLYYFIAFLWSVI